MKQLNKPKAVFVTLASVMSFSACAPAQIVKQPEPVVEQKMEKTNLEIHEFTGTLQASFPDGSVIGMVPGSPKLPISSGAVVSIFGGEATLVAGHTVITINRRASFRFVNKDKFIEIEVLRGKVSVIEIGGNEFVIEKGQKKTVKTHM